MLPLSVLIFLLLFIMDSIRMPSVARLKRILVRGPATAHESGEQSVKSLARGPRGGGAMRAMRPGTLMSHWPAHCPLSRSSRLERHAARGCITRSVLEVWRVVGWHCPHRFRLPAPREAAPRGRQPEGGRGDSAAP